MYAGTAPPVFANSLSISFGNLGITIGTAVSGWVIDTYGIHHTPWAMLALGAAALLLMVLREWLYRREQTTQLATRHTTTQASLHYSA